MTHCVHCGKSLHEDECVDTTRSNTETPRCSVGQHTGDIYRCSECEGLTLDNFLTGEVESWVY